jgi:hypothetical protein
MNAIEKMVQQQVATNHVAQGLMAIPAGFGKAMTEALSHTVAKAKAEAKSNGKWQALAALLIDGGWTLKSIDGSAVGKVNRDLIRAGMVGNWPDAKERANMLADHKTLSVSEKERVREIRQSFGPNFKLVERYIGEAEAKAAEAKAKAELEAAGEVEVLSEAEAKAAKEAEAKAEAEAKILKQFRKAIADAIRYVGNMEGAKQEDGTAVDLVKAKADLTAMLGRFPKAE